VRETTVVASAAPPKITVAPGAKFVPPTVTVKLPTGSKVGLTFWGTGTGFWRVTGLLAERVLSATLTACTFTEFGVGTLAGA